MRRIVVTALAAGLLTASPVVPQPAEAANLLEKLFPRAAERRADRRAQRRAERQRAYDRAVAAKAKRNRAAKRRASAPKKAVKKVVKKKRSARTAVVAATVSGSTYYTYKADAVAAVPLNKLSKVLTKAARDVAAERLAARDGALRAALASGLALDAAVAGLSSFDAPEMQLTDGADKLAALELSARKANGAAIVAHYAAEPRFLWVGEDGRPNEQALAVMDVLSGADTFGLAADDYALTEPAMVTSVALDGDAGEASRSSAVAAAMRFEFDLTAAALRYALDARHGLVNPDRISGYHDFPANKQKPDAAMAALAGATAPARFLLDSHPRGQEFDALKAALLALRAGPAEPAPVVVKSGTFLKPGMTSDQVPVLVEAIRRRASAETLAAHTAVFKTPPTDGLYSEPVVALVRDFQKEAGLGPDGIVGKRTLAKLSPDGEGNKLQKVLFAMERLRWHPDQLGATKVVINQPAYRASYWEDGREKLSMRTVVGKPENQTNFFHDTIDYVEFNPYWGIPKSILVNEMLPKLRRNAGYLDKLGYEITDLRGRPVSGWNVDWWSVGASFPYNVRQPPGPKNALGELKIMFPNKHDIYMHDTPARSLFKRDKRAYSHGCVRLADPRAMAAAVLGTSVSHVDERVSQRKNRTQKLNRKIPVYVGYFTAWPTADGEVQYFEDIYDRDVALAKAMTAEHSARAKASAI
ncbi:L,D-transpeptidase family protein [Rhizobiaceae bacterium]|nr:L,D-transpeptidase family protein [Rhizobiaceae bacterium]